MVRRVRRDEQGSIIITMLVSLVATGLIVAMLLSVESGLRRSRRAGDSANALQLADAGVNDAVRSVVDKPGPTWAPPAVTLGGAGSYQYTATLDPVQAFWHIDSVGTDSTGVRRRVRADAVGESLFASALFAQSFLSVPSGASVDSFQSGATPQAMCTRNGNIGTNNAAALQFGNLGQGTGTRNCVESTYGIPWPHPVDGCISYGDGSQPLPPSGTGKCPTDPARTKKESPANVPPQVQIPQGLTKVAQPLCDAANPIQGGNRYFWASVTLRPGCRVDPTNGPAVIFTDGPIDIGALTGSDRNVNPPPTGSQPGAAGCPDYPTTDAQSPAQPGRYYCPGWAANLRIFVVNGTSAAFKFRNGTKFWGLIVAPTRPVDVDGGGNPQVEMWGAIITTESAANAQFTLHYDDSLGGIVTGRYRVRNWREEPLGP